MKLKTIQEVAKLCKVSVRTLRFYDEIDLLSPRVRMTNGRSLYGTKELIYLSQIITFKEFGFSLKEIKSILKEKSRYKLSNLIAQRKTLSKKIDRLKNSLQMIESIINHYKEKPMSEMTPEQVDAYFQQMSSKKEYANYFNEEVMEEKSNKNREKFKIKVGDNYYECFIKKEEQQNALTAQDYGSKYGVFLNKLIATLERKSPPESKEVQSLINEQWEILQLVYPETRSQKIYFAIRDQLCDFPAGGEEVSALQDFLYRAMTTFGEENFLE